MFVFLILGRRQYKTSRSFARSHTLFYRFTDTSSRFAFVTVHSLVLYWLLRQKKKYLAGFSRVRLKDTTKFAQMLLHPKLAVIAETFSEISAYFIVNMYSCIMRERSLTLKLISKILIFHGVKVCNSI